MSSALRKAAQQALKALEADEHDMVLDQEGHMVFRKEAAITALKAALAEPREKPWRCGCGANLYIDENGAPRSAA